MTKKSLLSDTAPTSTPTNPKAELLERLEQAKENAFRVSNV